MNLGINEKRKLIGEFWRSRGTSGTSVFNYTVPQVFAVFNKYQDEIYAMLADNMNMNVYYAYMSHHDGQEPIWSDKEVDDYAFEEM